MVVVVVAAAGLMFVVEAGAGEAAKEKLAKPFDSVAGVSTTCCDLVAGVIGEMASTLILFVKEKAEIGAPESFEEVELVPCFCGVINDD